MLFKPKNYLKFILMPAHVKEQKFNQSERKKFIEANNIWNQQIYESEKAENYDELHQYNEESYEVKKIKDFLKKYFQKHPKAKVLEIGAGTGYYTKYYAKYVKEVTALEIGEDLAEELKNSLSKTKNAKIIIEDARTLKTKEKFDVILFLSTIHHIPFRLELLKNLSNSLNKKGEFVFIEPEHNLLRRMDLIRKYYTRLKKKDLRKKEYWGGHDFVSYSELKFYAKSLHKKLFVTSFDSVITKKNRNHEKKLLKLPLMHNTCRTLFAVIK